MEPSSRGKLPALAFDLVSRRRHWLLDSRAAGRLLLQDVSDREHECFGDRPRGGPSSAAPPAGDGGARSVENVPVPTVMVGVLPMPILAGQHALSVEYLLRSLQQGVLPSDTLADADRGVWRTASRVTDPISAFNVCQAQRLAGRRLILTERGVAEQLARSTIKIVPLESGSARSCGGPFAALRRLAGTLLDAHHLSENVQSRAKEFDRPSQSFAQQDGEAQAAGAATSAAGGSQPNTERLYTLRDLPTRQLLAGGSPQMAQLAWVPVRVALRLLAALPQHFVVLQALLHGDWPRGLAGSRPQRLAAATTPAGLQVYVLQGLSVTQMAPGGTSLEFTPTFLCSSQVKALWQDVREVTGGALLAYRRLQRALMCRRLEGAAAIISGGAVQASSPAQDEEDGGDDEPPEVAAFIRELGGGDARARDGGTGQPASSGLPRLASLFCCGLVSLVASALGWAGDVSDRLMMATPLGPRLLGVPEPLIVRCSLGELVGEMQRYNRGQAEARVGGGARALGALHEQQHQGQGQGPGEDGAGDSSAAPGSGADSGQAPADAGDALLAYTRALAASAIWLALSGKKAAELSGVAGVPLARVLGRSLTRWPGPGLGLPLAQVEEDEGAWQPPPDAELRAAIAQELAAALPLLEHNGLQACFEAGAGDDASLAQRIARHVSGDMQVSLGVAARDGASGGLSMLGASPPESQPGGRGLILVGDLCLQNRGRAPGGVPARWLSVGVDDGRALL